MTLSPGDELVGYSSNGTGWNALTQDVYDPIDEDEARRSHEEGGTYTTILRRDRSILTVAQLADSGVQVTEYEPTGTKAREFRDLRFVGDRLWVRAINRYNGPNTFPREQLVAEWFIWPAPGDVAKWQRFDHETPRGRVVEERTDWDPEPHWFTPPAFGDLAELTRPGLLEELWPGVTPMVWLEA